MLFRSRLLSETGLRTRMAVAGRRTIEDRYSLHVTAPRIAAVLAASLDRNAHAATTPVKGKA